MLGDGIHLASLLREFLFPINHEQPGIRILTVIAAFGQKKEIA
jgi:hypothetical protein